MRRYCIDYHADTHITTQPREAKLGLRRVLARMRKGAAITDVHSVTWTPQCVTTPEGAVTKL